MIRTRRRLGAEMLFSRTDAALEELLVPLLFLELPRAVQAVLLQVPVASIEEVMTMSGQSVYFL